MGKAFGALVRLLVTLAVLGLLGYNTWETAQLQVEVDSLKRAHHLAPGRGETAGGGASVAPSTAAGEPGGAGAADIPALLQAAKRHADAARAHLERKEYAEASHEMALSAQAAQKASAEAGAAGEDRFAALKRTLSAVQEKADSLLKEQSGGAGGGTGR